MSKKKVYVYPTILDGETKKNPYILCLLEGLKSGSYKVTNFTKKGKKGISDVFQHLDSNIFIINWPENLADRRFGFIQVIFYLFFLFIAKVKNAKLVWVMHNKEAHNKSSFLSNMCMFFTAKLSTFVLTHSVEGVDYFKKKYKKDNIFNFPHPVYPNLSFPRDVEPKYDFIIWGSIDPYKNILSFLSFVKENPQHKNYTFLICGKCKDEQYAQQISSLIKDLPNITFINEFLKDNELAEYIAESKSILYTYNQSSVLSSGALIYSLSSHKKIIGPNFGNFKELADNKIIATYSHFGEIFDIYDAFNPDITQIKHYEHTYTWQKFVEYIAQLEEKF